MAYSDVALLVSDNDFILRTRACVSTEGELDPVGWSNDYAWQMASTPGFGADYAYAVAMGVPRPGNDESVISDGEILSAVQAIRNGTEFEASDPELDPTNHRGSSTESDPRSSMSPGDPGGTP